MTMHRRMRRGVFTPDRRAFSLIELMIVILIIVLVVAIVVPALGAARTAAKTAATKNLMSSLQTAVSQFTADERRLPGVFSPAEMGSATNNAQGMSVMQNVMLELAPGGLVETGGIAVGPNTTSQVQVDPSLIASAKNCYFTPDAKYFKKQDGIEGGTRSVTNHEAIPELVDADGMPILMWIADPLAVQPIDDWTDFARIDSGLPGSATPARYYAPSNSVFLNHDQVGKKLINQNGRSLIGNTGSTNWGQSMTGFLGNPSSPKDPSMGVNVMVPTATRGSFVIHAAGPGGTYLGKYEPGGKAANGTVLYYGLNFKGMDGSAYTDFQNSTTTNSATKSIDVTTKFDDLILSGST